MGYEESQTLRIISEEAQCQAIKKLWTVSPRSPEGEEIIHFIGFDLVN